MQVRKSRFGEVSLANMDNIRAAIKYQAEGILSLAVIWSKNLCESTVPSDVLALRFGVGKFEISLFVCVLALRDVIAEAYAQSRLKEKGALFVAGYANLAKYICHAGEAAYPASFSKIWKAYENAESLRDLIARSSKNNQDVVLVELVHKIGVSFMRKEFGGCRSLSAEWDEETWCDSLLPKVINFCTRVHTVLDFVKWEKTMKKPDSQDPVAFCRKRYDVFITYRRSDGLSYAQLLYQAFDKFGYKCFLDVRDEQDGDYEKRIMIALRTAPNYIFLITEGSLQRLSAEGNNVSAELREALRLHKKVIPIAPSGVSRGLYGADLLDEFNCLRGLSISRFDVGELLDASVKNIIKRFPFKRRPVLAWIYKMLWASVTVLALISLIYWICI